MSTGCRTCRPRRRRTRGPGWATRAPQDRLFQMDYDRRRACGRWAEIAGSGRRSAATCSPGGWARRRRPARRRRHVAAAAGGVRGLRGRGQPGRSPPGRGRCPALPGRALAAVALGRRVHGPARADGPVAAQAGERGAAGAGRGRRLRAAGDPAGRRVAGRGAARRAADPPGRPAARRGARRRRRAPGVPGRGRARLQRVGGQRPADRARRRGDLQRLAPGARHPQRLLAVPRDAARTSTSSAPPSPGCPASRTSATTGRSPGRSPTADADTQDLYLEQFEGTRYRTPDGWQQAEVSARADRGARRRPGHRRRSG